MTRFFVRPEQIGAGFVTLDADDAHHLRAVLKARAGDRIAVLDGLGREYVATLTEVGKAHARAKIDADRLLQTEPATRITVAQALPKMAEKMEQVLQRGTEAGATAFWAFSSARSLPHLTGERHEKRLQRWSAIVKTAAEQSHRAMLPDVRAELTFDSLVTQAASFDVALFAYEGEQDRSLRQVLEALPIKPSTVLVVVGPEGGFTDSEAQQARAAGLISVSLGPRILRTETAALMLVAQILYALE